MNGFRRSRFAIENPFAWHTIQRYYTSRDSPQNDMADLPVPGSARYRRLRRQSGDREGELWLMATAAEIASGGKHYLPPQQIVGSLYTADSALTKYVARERVAWRDRGGSKVRAAHLSVESYRRNAQL